MASSHYHKKLENGLESTRHELFLSMNSFDGRTLEGRLDPRSRFCPRDETKMRRNATYRKKMCPSVKSSAGSQRDLISSRRPKLVFRIRSEIKLKPKCLKSVKSQRLNFNQFFNSVIKNFLTRSSMVLAPSSP